MSTLNETIDELMRLEARGMRAGICGREFCEGCGEPGSFSGFWGAFVAHSHDGRFVCSTCRRGEFGRGSDRDCDSGSGTGVMKSADYGKLDKLILARGFRYCAGCGVEVVLMGESKKHLQDEARRRPLTCWACGEISVGDEARRRYLEHKAKEPGGLERTQARLRWAKAAIQRMMPEEEG
jgi:hypothetical protein